MCDILNVIVIILMVVALVTIIIYNVYETISANIYYKECKKAHEEYLGELKQILKDSDVDEK